MKDETRRKLRQHLDEVQQELAAKKRKENVDAGAAEEFKGQCRSVLHQIIAPALEEFATVYRDHGSEVIVERGTSPKGDHMTLRVGPEGGRSGYFRFECDEERRSVKIIRSFQHVMAGIPDQVGEYLPAELTYDRVQNELDEFVAELVR